MSISLNPVDVWKLFSDGKKREKEQIAVWLEQTATEARNIADIWSEEAKKLSRIEKDFKSRVNPIDSQDTPNVVGPYYRLKESYESMSSVLGSHTDRSWQDSATDYSAHVLTRRDRVKELYKTLYGYDRPVVVIDEESRRKQLDELHSAIERLTGDAAALEVLARKFRAMP